MPFLDFEVKYYILYMNITYFLTELDRQLV